MITCEIVAAIAAVEGGPGVAGILGEDEAAGKFLPEQIIRAIVGVDGA